MACLELIGEVSATVVLVVGAEGAPDYGEAFAAWAASWEAAAARGGALCLRVGPGSEDPDPNGEATDRERLQELLTSLATEDPQDEGPLWVVYVGHGTFDGERAKLNLRGPDVSASELSTWLEPITRPTAVAICASSSAPFLNQLSRPGRIVVTATRSGHEYSYSRFGEYLSAAIADTDADLDKDEQVSLLEAFLFASAGTAEFYSGEARLASEHALLDDNGDGLGTPAAWFRGTRSTKTPEDDRVADGVHAHQLHLVPSDRERLWPSELRARRDVLELQLEVLRTRKADMPEEDYFGELEEILLALARLYRQLDEPEKD